MSGDKCKDWKISKESVSVLLACSATGVRLKPLVIAKAKLPRKYVNPENLPILRYADDSHYFLGMGKHNKQMA